MLALSLSTDLPGFVGLSNDNIPPGFACCNLSLPRLIMNGPLSMSFNPRARQQFDCSTSFMSFGPIWSVDLEQWTYSETCTSSSGSQIAIKYRGLHIPGSILRSPTTTLQHYSNTLQATNITFKKLCLLKSKRVWRLGPAMSASRQSSLDLGLLETL